jgi:hypothetical protein
MRFFILAFIPFITNKTIKNAVTLIVIPIIESMAIRLINAPALLEKIK